MIAIQATNTPSKGIFEPIFGALGAKSTKSKALA
jgi:hypothetical protein